MENILVAINVVVPLFVLMALGFFCRRIKIVSHEFFEGLNTLCFKLFLPCLLFRNIYGSDIDAVINWQVLVYVASAQIVVFTGSLIIIPRIIKERPIAASTTQAVFRSNFVALGLTIALSISGTEGAGLVSLLGAIVVPLYNVGSVIILETVRGERTNPRRLIKNVVTNPLIIAALLGLVLLVLRVPVPKLLLSPISDISRAATPITLFCLGGFFNYASIKRCRNAVIIGVSGRLLIVPAIFLSLAVFFGFRGNDFIAVLCAFITPTASASFSMAKQMGADEDTAALLVLFSTVGSLFTMAFWISFTRYLGIW